MCTRRYRIMDDALRERHRKWLPTAWGGDGGGGGRRRTTRGTATEAPRRLKDNTVRLHPTDLWDVNQPLRLRQKLTLLMPGDAQMFGGHAAWVCDAMRPYDGDIDLHFRGDDDVDYGEQRIEGLAFRVGLNGKKKHGISTSSTIRSVVISDGKEARTVSYEVFDWSLGASRGSARRDRHERRSLVQK